MATSLINTTPQNTYPSLLKLGDNSALSATLKRISDGAGNDTPIEISTAAVQFGGSTGMYWDNTNRRLGIGTNAPTTAVDVNGSIRAGVNLTVVGEIQNPTVGVVNINGELRVASPNVSIGLTSYPARLAVRGSGSTSATTSLLVQNSAGTASLSVLDNAAVVLGGTVSSLTSTPNDILITSSNNRVNGNWCVGNGGYNNASSILQADSTTKGFLPPRMTTAQRDAIVSPATGLKIYNTTLGTTDTYDGTSWQRVGRSTLIKGAGTTNATTALQVENSAGTSALTVNDAGFVGIGTNAPSEKLVVQTTTTADGIVLKDATNNLVKVAKWTDSSGFIELNTNNVLYSRIQASQTLFNTPVTIGAASGIAARLAVRGSGATSATTALRVENSAGTATLTVNDAGAVTVGSTLTFVSSNVIENTLHRLVATTGGVAVSSDYTSAAANTMLHVKGRGATSATTALRVENSAGTATFTVADNGNANINATSLFYFGDTSNFIRKSSTIDGVSVGGFSAVGIGAFGGLETFVVRAGSASLGATTANASALLDMVSTTKGFLPPRMTTTQKNAIASPAAGLVVYDTTTNKLCCYDGTIWNDLF